MAPSAVISAHTGLQVYRLPDKAPLTARLAGAIQSSHHKAVVETGDLFLTPLLLVLGKAGEVNTGWEFSVSL